MYHTIAKARKYCNSLTEYSRYKTRVVNVGDIPCGGDNPIRIQSMTTTDTMDTKGTVEQTIRMIKSGCEYVRITAPSLKEAKNLEVIKKELQIRGYNVPLIADIHFTPNAAELAARIVEKVRVNPGNYADKKKFEALEYTQDSYDAELERIRQKFFPLVKICKEYGTAMRIGTNHGSLSDRIMSRYGDTPLGMIESALEFVRICEEHNYHQIILSMKASNTQVMVQAYRLLIQKMEQEGMNYPLHLGVTEAGGGEDGRIKSALGIGTLLEDGLGDTIRVSLTEDPEYEAPVAVSLANRYKDRAGHKSILPVEETPKDPFIYERRNTFETGGIGGGNVPRVFADYSQRIITVAEDLNDIGYFYNSETDKWNMNDIAADFIYLGSRKIPFNIPNGLKPIFDYEFWIQQKNNLEGYPLLTIEQYVNSQALAENLNFIKGNIVSFTTETIEKIKHNKTSVLVLETDNKHGTAEQRRVFFRLMQHYAENPVIIKRTYNQISTEELSLYTATDFGLLLIEGFGDGAWAEVNSISKLRNSNNKDDYILSFAKAKESKEKIINRLLFGILQAARVRISKTEYIACPSCGRTLFDLQETTEMIRKRTEHLKGVKIAIMGCIVNGPGEMADADYGYVGSGAGRITLYKGKNIVKRNIPSKNAVDNLVEIIKEGGNWQEPT